MAPLTHPVHPPLGPARAAWLLVTRSYIVYRQAWKLFLTGFLEPVFFLFSIGIGVGQLIEAFEVNRDRNLYKIWNRLSSGTYFPPAVKAVEIPKPAGNGVRVLGVPTEAA